jgi:hypothetical protein
MANRRILLVEGKDDEHVFKALFGRRGLPHLDEIKEHEGYVRLLEAIPIRLKESDIGALGIVIDADSDLLNRWHSVRDRLRESGYANTPDQADAAGLVIDAPANSLLPRIGVWLMPNNQTQGILEDFLRHLVPPNNVLYGLASGAANNIPQAHRLFREADMPKAVIHTWLAWQAEPGKPFGTAITAGFLQHQSAEVDVLIAWLNRLFFT